MEMVANGVEDMEDLYPPKASKKRTTMQDTTRQCNALHDTALQKRNLFIIEKTSRYSPDFWRMALRRIFPEVVLGNSSTNSMIRGYL
jgi:hypothetical protein